MKDGLAHAWTELQQTDTALEVYGDSDMIIQQQKWLRKGEKPDAGSKRTKGPRAE